MFNNCFLEKGRKIIRGDVFILPKNANLKIAQRVKNDEFYTQFNDIAAEITAYYEYNHDVFRNKIILMPCDDPERSNFVKFFATNFKRYGIKALISTSYAKSGTNKLTDIAKNSPYYDASKHNTHGKLFVMTGDMNNDGLIDSDDVSFQKYLEGDGDFRSAEVTKLRDEADIVVTNPPFSLFREFLKWIIDGKKQFIILGNKNAIGYKESFSLIKENKMWLGTTSPKEFITPSGSTKKISGLTRWFTNLDHGIRHEEMLLDTMANNLHFNKSLKKKLTKYGSSNHYPKYDNYDAIEIPIVKCIPSDYKGIMGVPISFLDKYNPEQFEIVGKTSDLELSKTYSFFQMPSSAKIKQYKNDNTNWRAQNAYFVVEGKPVSCYMRIFIRNKN